MDIKNWHQKNFESRLSGRYISLAHIAPILEDLESEIQISIIGQSELGKDIHLLSVGNGSKKVLAWSQMHGNEATTTKSVFDFLKLLLQKEYFQKEIDSFLNSHTLYIIPILNPDGAEKYTRFNANEIDLNRDAQNLTQKESVVLREAFESIQPDLCLNLHGQRTIFGFGDGKPAMVSFLSPSADAKRTITNARQTAIRLIEKMNNFLQIHIPEQVGRYDDGFNINCVGDSFTHIGVPTILFEAGQAGVDYNRKNTREMLFLAICALFEIIETPATTIKYDQIPENQKNYKDVVLKNVAISDDSFVDIAIMYKEILKDGIVNFQPFIEQIGGLKGFYAHKIIECSKQPILINCQENVFVNQNISNISFKNGKSIAIFV